MINLIKKLIGFLEKNYFSAEIIKDEIKTGTNIEYFLGGEMKINNLGPDFPPYIWFKKEHILFSYNDEKWEEFKRFSGIELFRLLDPRLILKSLQNKREIAKYRIENLGVIAFKYLIYDLDLKIPKKIVKWLKRYESVVRDVKFYIRNGIIYQMDQMDLPPRRSKISLKFHYYNHFIKKGIGQNY